MNYTLKIATRNFRRLGFLMEGIAEWLGAFTRNHWFEISTLSLLVLIFLYVLFAQIAADGVEKVRFTLDGMERKLDAIEESVFNVRQRLYDMEAELRKR